MATRQTRLLTKNSTSSNQVLPSSILKGEAVVNLNDGILFYSGASGGNFTPFVDPNNASSGGTFFEVGSNLYNLQLRNQITQYQGFSGISLNGQFLSGTSTGFVLAPISSIQGVDRHVTGFTYIANTNTFEITQTQGGPTKTATFNEVSGLTVNGDLTVTGNTSLNGTLDVTGNTVITNFTGNTGLINGNLTVTGNTEVNGTLNVTGNTVITNFTGNTGLINGDLTVTGNTSLNGTLDVTGNTVITNFTGGTGLINGDLTVTGNTSLNGTLDVTGNTVITNFTGGTGLINGDLTVTGDTNVNGKLNVTGDTIITSFTGGTGLINGNLTVTGNTNISGNTTINGNVSISGFGNNLVVYTDGSGNLKTKTGFGYLEGTDLLTVKNLTVNNTGQTANFGVGGVVIGSGGSVGPSGGTAGTGDLVVHGSLTVFGNSISAFTSNLYIEDNNIILNYNPTGSTASSSVNSGFQIQDGGGTSGNSVNLDVVRLEYLSGVTTAQTPYELSEYTGNEDNYLGRGWITQLNDIVIRSTDVVDNGVPGSITGVRVLAEFDVLDGGTY
jgi:hypothetical protein